MALKLRRGTELNRVSMTPSLAEGELAYVTDHVGAGVSPLWVGDGSTAGGLPVAPVLSVNDNVGQVVLYTDDITEDDTPTNLWFSKDRAQDAAAALLLGATGTDGNLTVGSDNSIHDNISFVYDDLSGRVSATVPIPTTVNTSTTNSVAYYAEDGSTVSGGTALTWDNSSNILTVTRGRIVVTSETTPAPVITMSSQYNSAGLNSIRFVRSRGTPASPTVPTQGDRIGDIEWLGYDSTTFIPTATIGAYILKPVSTGVAPSGIGLYTTGADGVLKQNLRVLDTGKTIIGPGAAIDPGTGSLLIASTSNPQTDFFNNSALGITQFFDGVDCQNISMLRSRGTWTSPTALQSGDELGELAFYSRDTNSITSSVLSAQITASVDGAVSTGVAPGALTFFTRNTASNSVAVMKISAPSSSTTVGRVLVSGTIATTSTPGTFWNYDSSSSTLDLATNDTVTFANFSGSVLVNCYNSGTVTQYLCGGGGAPIAAGSSKVTATGTMSASPGSAGYTFTASETGLHSFYVIRTRSGA